MKMKKLGIAMLIGALCLSILGGCAKQQQVTKTLKVAALNGPTGMGMVKLMEDNKENYEISFYQSADEIVGKVVSGEVDIACVPSNMGAVLYNKTSGGIKLLGVNTMGVLYIVENGKAIASLEDLKGKTIVASGKGGTPEYVLNDLLLSTGIDPEKDVDILYLANHTDVVTKVVTEEGTIALLPEPHVTIAKNKNNNLQVALDLNEQWLQKEGGELPMGVIIAQSALANEREKDLEVFLADYKSSVDFVNEKSEEAAALIEKHGIVANKAIALAAIPNCNIVFKPAKEAKAEIETFYGVLEEVNPKAIGGTMPDEAFYYSK